MKYVGMATAGVIAAAGLLEGKNIVHPYLDIGGVPTVCTGHTGPDVKMGQNWLMADCDAILKSDLIKHGTGILQCINVPISQNEYDAYTLFAFNVGVSGFCNSSTVLKQLNAGNHTAACNGMSKWVYVDGKYSVGLANRRKTEVAMCLAK